MNASCRVTRQFRAQWIITGCVSGVLRNTVLVWLPALYERLWRPVMQRFTQSECAEFAGNNASLVVMNNDNADRWQQNANMTEAEDKKLRQKVYVFMHRRMQRGQRFSLSTDDLIRWIEDNGHVNDSLKRSGLNGIQPIDATAPISLDNIWFDPEKACRQTSRCAGVKKVANSKGFSGGNSRDCDNYRVLRMNEWIEELRQNAAIT